jgi:hypothetical protein
MDAVMGFRLVQAIIIADLANVIGISANHVAITTSSDELRILTHPQKFRPKQ